MRTLRVYAIRTALHYYRSGSKNSNNNNDTLRSMGVARVLEHARCYKTEVGRFPSQEKSLIESNQVN